MENSPKHPRRPHPEPNQTKRHPRRWEQRMRNNASKQVTIHGDGKVSGVPKPLPTPTNKTSLKAAPDEAARLKSSSRPQSSKKTKQEKCPPCHWGLLATTLFLVFLSIPLIYSASVSEALDSHGSSTYFMGRQLIFAIAGIFLMIIVSRLSRRSMIILGWVLFGATVLGLIAIKWTPLGYAQGNAKRWLKIGPVTLQVSEFAKIAVLLVLAHFWSLSARGPEGNKTLRPWLISGAFLVLPVMMLVFLEPHFSGSVFFLGLLLIVGLFGGTPMRLYIKIVASLILTLGLVLTLSYYGKMPLLKPYQQERIVHSISPDKDQQGGNYQKLQALRAIKRGGLLGVGPGNSIYKQGHLPEPYTDFILATTGEEWGLAGMLFLLALYCLLIFFCLQVGYNAGSLFEMLFATGMAGLFALQVLLNSCVAIGWGPVTGILLPFISYGGSGLVALLLGVGIVLGISRRRDVKNVA